MRLKPATRAIATALVLACPQASRADDGKRFTLAGLTFGLRFGGERPTAPFAGIEVSRVALYDHGTWGGLYSDLVYDFGASAARLTLGPEVGYRVFGADGGPALEVGKDGFRAGFALRPVLTLGVIGSYLRWERLWGGENGADVGELGILLKYPVAPRNLPGLQ